MKKIFNQLLFLAFSFTFIGCLDNDNESFYPSIKGYIFQKNINKSTYFEPFFFIYTDSYSHPITNASIATNNNLFISIEPFSSEAWFSKSNTLSATNNLMDLYGTYTFSIYSNDLKYEKDIPISNLTTADIMGTLTIDTLYYENGTITAVVDSVKNAAFYGIIVTPSIIENETYTYHTINNNYKTSTNTAMDNHKLSLSFPFSNSDEFEKYQIAVFVSSTNGVILISDERKILSKNASKFDE